MGRAVVATLLALCPLLAGAACTAGQSRQSAASSRVAASWFGLRRSGAFRVLGAVDYRKKTGVYTAGGLEPVLFTVCLDERVAEVVDPRSHDARQFRFDVEGVSVACTVRGAHDHMETRHG